MAMYNPKRALVKKLRSEGKTYEETARLANCSIGFAHKWGKYANRVRENLHVNTLTPSVKKPTTSSVNVNVKTVKTPFTNSSSRSSSRMKTEDVNVRRNLHRFGERESSPVNVKVKKSLSTGRSIILVFIILVVCVLFVWVYLFPETKAKESPDNELKKTFGFEGKSVEDLGIITGDDLPQNSF